MAPVFSAACRNKVDGLSFPEPFDSFGNFVIRNIAERLWGQECVFIVCLFVCFLFLFTVIFLLFSCVKCKKDASLGENFAFELIPQLGLCNYSFLESNQIRLKMKLR